MPSWSCKTREKSLIEEAVFDKMHYTLGYASPSTDSSIPGGPVSSQYAQSRKSQYFPFQFEPTLNIQIRESELEQFHHLERHCP
jgi:hypothetical protein